MNTAQVLKNRTSNLGALGYVQCMDTAQMHKDGVSDVTDATHVQRVDTAQMHKGGVSNIVAITHVQHVDAAQMHKVCVPQIFTVTNICSSRHWKTTTPIFKRIIDESGQIIPLKVCHHTSCLTASSPEGISILHCKKSQDTTTRMMFCIQMR